MDAAADHAVSDHADPDHNGPDIVRRHVAMLEDFLREAVQDFGRGDIMARIAALRNEDFDFGSLSGKGTIAGVGFTGTLTGTGSTTGEFGGGFFGPKAAEYGYAWDFTGSDFTAEGFASGKKTP